MQDEPFAWNLHEDHKAGVRPMEYYGKKTVARYIAELWRRTDEYGPG